MCGQSASTDCVFKNADAVDLAADNIAAFEVPPCFGRHTEGDAAGGAGCDNGTRFQRHSGGKLLYYIRYVEYHIVRIAALAKLAVYIAADTELRHCADRLSRHNARPHGRKVIETLAEVPLLMAGLEIAGRYIIYNCIAVYVIAGLYLFVIVWFW